MENQDIILKLLLVFEKHNIRITNKEFFLTCAIDWRNKKDFIFEAASRGVYYGVRFKTDKIQNTLRKELKDIGLENYEIDRIMTNMNVRTDWEVYGDTKIKILKRRFKEALYQLLNKSAQAVS